MEDGKDGTGISSGDPKSPSLSDPPISSPQPQPLPGLTLAPAPAPAPAPASAMRPTKEVLATEKRQMFTVELRRNETTIVSWKKLLRESGVRNGEASAPVTNNPLPDARPVAGVSPGEDDLKHTLQPPNCFSAVIEKIERLYMGRESSDDEELDDVPDEDQYDTEDSFIDDTELDEYFQIDKLSTKHNGYFVNRGKLEMVESSSSPNLAPKKRRRKDAANVQSGTNCDHVPYEHLSMGNMKIKAAARNAPLVSKKLTPVKVVNSVSEHHQEGKDPKTKSNASTVIYKKHTADVAINSDIPPSAKLPNQDTSSLKIESLDIDKNRSLSAKDKSSDKNESFDATDEASREKATLSQVERPQKKLFGGENEIEAPAKFQRKDRYETVEYSQMSSSMSTYCTREVLPSSHRAREGIIRPKGTTLERAIRDLEKIVSLSRPSNTGVQEVDPSAQGVKRRLPQEVKHKLAKVARLSASQSKISGDELIDRLMGFLGHLVQRNTLKRNLREMVQLGLSAKQQKADKFLQIKKEVVEMIKARASHLISKVSDQQHALTNDFQNVVSADERRALTGRCCMDVVLEEKICDLYDIYVEGMDEDKGPQSRKLYVELAELWPAGYMDNLGIKDAIYRAKKRRRHKFQVCDEERIERKKLAIEAKLEEPSTQLQAVQQSPAVDPAHQVPGPQDKPISSLKPPLVGRLSEPTAYFSDSAPSYVYGSKHHEKAIANGSGMVSDSGSKAPTVNVKKRIKRKSESDGEFNAHPQKIQGLSGKEKQNLNRHSDGTNLILQQLKPSVQMPPANTSHQPS